MVMNYRLVGFCTHRGGGTDLVERSVLDAVADYDVGDVRQAAPPAGGDCVLDALRGQLLPSSALR